MTSWNFDSKSFNTNWSSAIGLSVDDFEFYSRTPPNFWKIKDPSVTYVEENRNCGETMTVHLKFEWDILTEWWFEWSVSAITKGCSSFFWENAVWLNATELLELNEEFVFNIGIKTTKRRRFSSVFALLATRNATHMYLNDWKKDDFSDIFLD